MNDTLAPQSSIICIEVGLDCCNSVNLDLIGSKRKETTGLGYELILLHIKFSSPVSSKVDPMRVGGLHGAGS